MRDASFIKGIVRPLRRISVGDMNRSLLAKACEQYKVESGPLRLSEQDKRIKNKYLKT